MLTFGALAQALSKVASATGNQACVAEVAHDFSTSQANSQLLAAVLNGRDVIMDGTLAWGEYAKQTIEMLRMVHLHTFSKGPGYRWVGSKPSAWLWL
jgi:hypothetical protein